MNNKILIINKSSHFGDYLKEKILSFNIDIINTKDSIDGLIKMRNVNTYENGSLFLKDIEKTNRI